MITTEAAQFRAALPSGGRLLGLDVGTRTIGTALCDAGWHFASPAELIDARIAELGGDPPGLTPEGGTTPQAFEAFIKAEIAKWAEVVRVSGAKVD